MKFFKTAKLIKTAGVDISFSAYTITPEELARFRSKWDSDFNTWEEEKEFTNSFGHGKDLDVYDLESVMWRKGAGNKLIRAYIEALMDLDDAPAREMMERLSGFYYDPLDNNPKKYTKENAEKFIKETERLFKKYKGININDRPAAFDYLKVYPPFAKETTTMDDAEMEMFIKDVKKAIADPKVKSMVVEWS